MRRRYTQSCLRYSPNAQGAGGIIYQSYNTGYLARLMLDVRHNVLDSNYTDREEIEWDGKED